MSTITVVIETPRLSAGKYVYDRELQCYKLKKMLPLGMYFPYDFGMIENTEAPDGDPIDAMVITEFITYPGIRIECRLIGAMEAEQKEESSSFRNDRYFLIPEASVVFKHIDEIKDFSKEHNQQLEDFFSNYNKVENKEFDVIKFVNADKAKKNLKKHIKSL